MSDDELDLPEEDVEESADEAVAPAGRWLPEGRTLRDELRQPRYAAVAAVALIVILLQLWVLF
ncbi:MAG: hypothetical protein IT335_15665 [Thermomicrobiales bacterium]|jgi:hypothetical protein|nr:hypothetical protein [Thermomicrobiales bacterium]